MNFEKEQTELSEKERLLNEYSERFSGMSEIGLEDLVEMKENGISTEDFLNFIGSKNDYLFHGSRVELGEQDNLEPSLTGDGVFMSSNPAISIMRAIYSNKDVENLGYPYVINDEYPLKLTIVTKDGEISPDTIGEKGYVYVIQNSNEFENEPKGSWQYIKKDGDQTFLKRIEVEKSDFDNYYEVETK